MCGSSLSSLSYVLSETGPKQAQNSESGGKKGEGASNQRQFQQRLPLCSKLQCRQTGALSGWGPPSVGCQKEQYLGEVPAHGQKRGGEIFLPGILASIPHWSKLRLLPSPLVAPQKARFHPVP